MSGYVFVGVDRATGLVLGPGISNFTIEGKVVAAVGDKIEPHGKGPHSNAVLVTGSSSNTVYGKIPALSGYPASCGCIVTGSDKYTSD